MGAKCPTCSAITEIPWLEKMPFPQQPIDSNDKSGTWVPVSISIKCCSELCNGTYFHHPIPKITNLSTWNFYGDEAGRYISSAPKKYSESHLNFFCITLVGLHRDKHDIVKKKIYDLKKSIRPNEDPSSWVHHFSDIWSSNGISGKYSLKNKEDKIAHAKRFAKIIAEARPHLFSINTSSCIEVPSEVAARKKHIKFQKEDIFSQSIMSALKVSRDHEVTPRFIFDNIQDTTTGAKVEGWAAECFLGLQYTRLFTWISAGVAVKPPEFVSPGSNFLLEIADFISYCVAREFERSVLEEKAEFPTRLLGYCFYQGGLSNGDSQSRWQTGLPIEEFYGLRKR